MPETKTNNGSAEQAEAQETIRLEPLALRHVLITVQGKTPLLPHKWSEKARKMMRDKQTSTGTKTKKAREPKNPEEEAEAATYRLPDGRPGMPAAAFKAAIVDAARYFDGITFVDLKQAITVVGEGPEQLVPIEGDSYIREDMPRITYSTTDLRYRRCFPEWEATIPISYVENVIDPESIVALVNAAGMGGVGDWRPSSPRSKSGSFGTFAVVPDRIEVIEE